MTLVDTSVWIDHLRRGNERLSILLFENQVLCHPFVIGELACGNLKNRSELLVLLTTLPEAVVAEHSEVLHLLDSHQLYGIGLSLIDIHLLASALLTGSNIWTFDKQLHAAADTLKIS